jgi:hypothetical protein
MKLKDKACFFDMCYGMYLDKFNEDDEKESIIPLTEEEFGNELGELAMDNYNYFLKATEDKTSQGSKS